MMGPPVLRGAGHRSGGTMKLDLLWVFEDGREVWMNGRESFERPPGYTWFNDDLEAAREEALRVDEVRRLSFGCTLIVVGERRAVFSDVGWARLLAGGAFVTQATAFTWLFTGRLG